MLRLAMVLLCCGVLLALAPAARADEPAAVMHDRSCTPVGWAATSCATILPEESPA